ncbi:MAG: 2-keto-4-pentenoate hydratase [Paracoccaceae bacterium]|jgi:2-keto-4-pentenoate hydratase
MTQSSVDAWVDVLLAARETAHRYDVAISKPAHLEDVYRIQSGVAARVGAVGGFKTARRGDAAPIMAPIFHEQIAASGAQLAVKDLLGIELEVGFEILRDCPADVASLPAAELVSILRPVAVIELVDTRIRGPLVDDPFIKLADNQINAGLVVGAAAQDWSGADFGTVQATMRAGADVLLDGETTVPGGSALETFAALAGAIGAHCGGLKPGQIVITGSLHPLVYYPAGTQVSGWIAGIGAVSLTLGA